MIPRYLKLRSGWASEFRHKIYDTSIQAPFSGHPWEDIWKYCESSFEKCTEQQYMAQEGIDYELY